MDRKHQGIAIMLVASVIWASMVVLAKALLSSYNYLQLTAAEAVFGFLAVFSIFLFREGFKIPRLAGIKGKDVKRFLLVALMGAIIAPLLFFFGLSMTYAVNAALIAHMQPLFIAFMGAYFLRERITRADIAGGLLLTFSVVIISSRTIENLTSLRIGNLGDLAVLISTIFWACTAIVGKLLSRSFTSAEIVSVRMLLASLFFIPLLAFTGQLAFSPLLALLGIVTGCGYILYYEGLKRMKTAEVGMVELSTPFFAAIIALAFIGEAVTELQIAGGLLMAAGIYVMAMGRD